MNYFKRVTTWLLFITAGPINVATVYFSPNWDYFSANWDYFSANPWAMTEEHNAGIWALTTPLVFLAALHGSAVYRSDFLRAERIATRRSWPLIAADAGSSALAVTAGWALSTAVVLTRAYLQAVDTVTLPLTMPISGLVSLLAYTLLGVALGRAGGKILGPLLGLTVGTLTYAQLPGALYTSEIDPYTSPVSTVP